MKNLPPPVCPDCGVPMRLAWVRPNHRGCPRWECAQGCEGVVVYTRDGVPVDSIDALAGQGSQVLHIK